jgi:GT2 family glycosyltransferase
VKFNRAVVIILHYRGIAETAACLGSVLTQRRAGLEVLLVDNGGAEDMMPLLERFEPDINVLRLTTNQGWAGGNNAGIAWARAHGATMVCLLNNDTIVPAGVLDSLVDAADACGNCLMHPAIDYADATEGVQLDPSTDPKAVRFGHHANVFVLDFAYGACLMVPMAVFDCVGGFDERFFLQLEETDFYHRARRLGIPSLCLAAVRIIHAESRSFGGRVTPDKTYYSMRNSLLLAAKNFVRPRIAIGVLKRAYWVTALRAVPGSEPSLWRTLRWFVSRHEHAQAARAGVHDFLFRRFGARRSANSP